MSLEGVVFSGRVLLLPECWDYRLVLPLVMSALIVIVVVRLQWPGIKREGSQGNYRRTCKEDTGEAVCGNEVLGKYHAYGIVQHFLSCVVKIFST